MSLQQLKKLINQQKHGVHILQKYKDMISK